MIQQIQVGIIYARAPADAGQEMVVPHSLGLTCKTITVQATTQSLAVSANSRSFSSFSQLHRSPIKR
jgi:hypothetical protein